MITEVQPSAVLQSSSGCCCSPEWASSGVSPACETQARWAAGTVLSKFVKCPPAYHHLPRAHIQRGAQRQTAGTAGREDRQSRDFLFAFADRSRDKGRYPTITGQIPQGQCSSLWDVASQKSSPPNAAQKGWHNHTVKPKHCSRFWRLNLKNARPGKTLLQSQSQTNSGRLVDWNGNALTVLVP